MPVNDWTRVAAGTFHDFHCSWIIHLKEAMNSGLLPKGYYAQAEQHAGKMVANPIAAYRAARRTIAIRHASGHYLIALVEIISPSNKDRHASLQDFVEKVRSAIDRGIHVLVIDILPPARHDPHGVHAVIWESLGSESFLLPADRSLTLVSYAAYAVPEAYVESIAIGDTLPDMPLFIENGHYVNVPLERTYLEAYRGVPAVWQDVIEGRSSTAGD